MKRYKPYKGMLIMFLITILFVSASLFILNDDNEKAKITGTFLLFVSLLMVFMFLAILFYFTVIYEDKIIFRQGYYINKDGENPNKRLDSWLSNFRNTTIYFNEIEKVDIIGDLALSIIKKNGDRLFITFNGYSKKVREEIFNSLK